MPTASQTGINIYTMLSLTGSPIPRAVDHVGILARQSEHKPFEVLPRELVAGQFLDPGRYRVGFDARFRKLRDIDGDRRLP